MPLDPELSWDLASDAAKDDATLPDLSSDEFQFTPWDLIGGADLAAEDAIDLPPLAADLDPEPAVPDATDGDQLYVFVCVMEDDGGL